MKLEEHFADLSYPCYPPIPTLRISSGASPASPLGSSITTAAASVATGIAFAGVGAGAGGHGWEVEAMSGRKELMMAFASGGCQETRC